RPWYGGSLVHQRRVPEMENLGGTSGIGGDRKICNAQICDALMRDRGDRCYGVHGSAPEAEPGSGVRTRVEDPLMRTLQPAEWSKPRGFSHGLEVSGPGRWIVLAGQTGGDEKGEYQPDMAAQVGIALRRIIKLLEEAGA